MIAEKPKSGDYKKRAGNLPRRNPGDKTYLDYLIKSDYRMQTKDFYAKRFRNMLKYNHI